MKRRNLEGGADRKKWYSEHTCCLTGGLWLRVNGTPIGGGEPLATSGGDALKLFVLSCWLRLLFWGGSGGPPPWNLPGNSWTRCLSTGSWPSVFSFRIFFVTKCFHSCLLSIIVRLRWVLYPRWRVRVYLKKDFKNELTLHKVWRATNYEKSMAFLKDV